jgi:hypothetical protein
LLLADEVAVPISSAAENKFKKKERKKEIAANQRLNDCSTSPPWL